MVLTRYEPRSNLSVVGMWINACVLILYTTWYY